MTIPILYTFRRCPYAIRTRMLLRACHRHVELREIELKNKPHSMLAISPKGTVPVLQLPDGRVLEESRYIMRWAYESASQEAIKNNHALKEAASIKALLDTNDGDFKHWLDREIWQDILNLPQVGITDNFFACGVNSLSAIKSVDQINVQLNTTLTLETMFEAQTIELFAIKIEEQLSILARTTESTNAPSDNQVEITI